MEKPEENWSAGEQETEQKRIPERQGSGQKEGPKEKSAEKQRAEQDRERNQMKQEAEQERKQEEKGTEQERKREERNTELLGTFSTSGTIRERLEELKGQDFCICVPIGGDTHEYE